MHRMMSHNLWGDKTITNLGIKVMKRHSSICQRYEPSHEKTCSTWYSLQHYGELRQNMEVICINTKNVGLLPSVVCESGMTCYVDGGSSTLSSTQLF